MKRVLIVSLSLLATLALGMVMTAAYKPAPTLTNQVLVAGRGDLDLTSAQVEEKSAIQEWSISIPWSSEGLGGADQYLGEVDIGVPASGGAAAPLMIVVCPAGLVAVEDRGTTRLYDSNGIFQGERAGVPIGFGPNAELATTGGGGPLTVYDQVGSVLWYADPWSEAFVRFGLGDLAAAGLVRASASPFTSPAGDVYWPMRIEVGEIVTIPSPDEPEAALPQWETVEAFDAFLLYDAAGNLLRCGRETVPQKLVFTPNGTVFGLGAAAHGGIVLREFTVERDAFRYLRSVEVPAGTVYGAGRDASLLLLEPLLGSGPLRFTVYAAGGSGRAARFSLPDGHGFVAADAEERLYSSLLTTGGLQVSCWRWPTP